MRARAWSRTQAIDYFRNPCTDVELGRDRPIYRMAGSGAFVKVGQIRILEVRLRAEKELAGRFDIREFHDAVLRNGNLPMEMLEEIVA